eukprot:403356105
MKLEQTLGQVSNQLDQEPVIPQIVKTGDFLILYVDSDNQRIRIDQGGVVDRGIQFSKREIYDYNSMTHLKQLVPQSSCQLEDVYTKFDIKSLIQQAFEEENEHMQYYGIVPFDYELSDDKYYHKFQYYLIEHEVMFTLMVDHLSQQPKWSILLDLKTEESLYFQHEVIAEREEFNLGEFSIEGCPEKGTQVKRESLLQFNQ